MVFQASSVPPPENPQHRYVVLVHQDEIVVDAENPGSPLSSQHPVLANFRVEAAVYIGQFKSGPCYAIDSDALESGLEQAPVKIKNSVDFSSLIQSEGLLSVRLRELLGSLSDERFQMLGRALQLVKWAKNHQYCGVCGTKTGSELGECAKRCPKCAMLHYPKIAPCVIALVTRGDECLLARHKRLPTNMYSTLAGYVEPGETLEQALRREIMEEVRIEIDNIRYFGSQPWPFPAQLMIGFIVDYKSGNVQADEIEIEAADWFKADELPEIPPISTISGQLINQFLESNQ